MTMQILAFTLCTHTYVYSKISQYLNCLGFSSIMFFLKTLFAITIGMYEVQLFRFYKASQHV
jgi:hypothetical protein